jgi:hypothetical protein
MILLQYFFKLSVSLSVIYLFYYFILRRLTFLRSQSLVSFRLFAALFFHCSYQYQSSFDEKSIAG